ncbi:MAG: Unknown protein [uncultured Thiotrichaceae bacterium]|uniref:Uncharacterized protein n=1 Tax=uncultured Thiotrichaceae bacterium TaxID=298394 RepID=A0A6S6SVQ6_9GAMM|nr:MAG: Unknown protein [uncultured Thiotrichaceae bacterium]
MNYKQFFLTFIVAFFIFALLVFLGMKFEWAKSFRADDANTLNLPPEQAMLIQSDTGKERPKVEVPKYELVDEAMQPKTSMDMIRNDCIRASRHAGVTDADIFRVVDECVAMELRKQGGTTPNYDNANDLPNSDDNASNDESYQLTREACEMVATENTTASPEELEKQIQECITENLDN